MQKYAELLAMGTDPEALHSNVNPELEHEESVKQMEIEEEERLHRE